MIEQRPKILIVDDDEGLRTTMVSVFLDAGFDVAEAHDGVDATLKIDAQAFDVIITDVNMPRMNGLQLAANAKSSQKNSGAPLFIMSGDTNQEVLRRAVEFKAVHILPKPFDLDTLLRSVKGVLDAKSDFSSHRPEVAACFAGGATDILKIYFGDRVTVGAASSPGDVTSNSFASATVVLLGDDSGGFLALSLGQTFIKHMSGVLFPGIDVRLSDSLICDIAGEMANQVAGRVKARLAVLDTDVRIGLPQVVLGLGHKIMRKEGGPILRFEITADSQHLIMEFGLRGSKIGKVAHPTMLGRGIAKGSVA